MTIKIELMIFFKYKIHIISNIDNNLPNLDNFFDNYIK